MTTTINITKNHNLHNTYGGRIYNSDFDTEFSYGNVASRIISDWKFDQQCKKNIENKERMRKNND